MMNNIKANTGTLVGTNKFSGTNIGKLLLDLGKINAEDAEQILRLQGEEGLRFGDAALKLNKITEADLKQALSLQFEYPYIQPNENHFSDKLVAAYDPFSLEVEALRALRSQLILRWFSEGYKSISIVSPDENTGANYLAANLAVVFSQLGEQTLLIDANLRQPSQHKIFNLNQTKGLSDILAGRAGLEVLNKIDSFMDLTVLGAGTVPPNPQELLSRENFSLLLQQVSTTYDVIIIDNAPSCTSSDAQTVSRQCAGSLLVSRLNDTKIANMVNVRDTLITSGVKIVGAVVNDF